MPDRLARIGLEAAHITRRALDVEPSLVEGGHAARAVAHVVAVALAEDNSELVVGVDAVTVREGVGVVRLELRRGDDPVPAGLFVLEVLGDLLGGQVPVTAALAGLP